MRGRLLALPVIATVVSVVATIGWSGTALAGGASQVSFQIADARAYAYKASIPQPVVQIAPKCTNNPKQDKYHCQGYNEQPNCPPKVGIGPAGQPADPKPPSTVDGQNGQSGGAGQGAGNDPNGTGVPQSSAVRLNRLLSDASLGREGSVLTANGLASLQYTELGTPPWDSSSSDPDASHTETDAFTNQDNYEERCYATDSNGNYSASQSSHVKPGDSFAHMFSHSLSQPETVEYAECFQSQCQFPNGSGNPIVDHGVTQVHLWQTGDVVNGLLSAELWRVTFPGDQFQIDELQTYVSFSSDGTAAGLHWNVTTSAHGVTLGGNPINLPEGQSIELGSDQGAVAVGLAGPYVSTSKDGSDLQVVAPGLFVATDQQTAFLAGAEVTANFSQGFAAPTFPPLPSTSSGTQAFLPPSTGSSTSGGGGGGGFVPSGGGGGSSGGTSPGFGGGSSGGGGGAVKSSTLSQSQPQFALLSKNDPPWAPVSILLLGMLGLLIVLLRWVQQFEWGRRMYEVQPMRALDWLYRAFLKP